MGADTAATGDLGADRTDPRVIWLAGHAVELATVTPPADVAGADFSDLAPLVDCMGAAPVVIRIIGAQSAVVCGKPKAGGGRFNPPPRAVHLRFRAGAQAPRQSPLPASQLLFCLCAIPASSPSTKDATVGTDGMPSAVAPPDDQSSPWGSSRDSRFFSSF